MVEAVLFLSLITFNDNSVLGVGRMDFSVTIPHAPFALIAFRRQIRLYRTDFMNVISLLVSG